MFFGFGTLNASTLTVRKITQAIPCCMSFAMYQLCPALPWRGQALDINVLASLPHWTHAFNMPWDTEGHSHADVRVRIASNIKARIPRVSLMLFWVAAFIARLCSMCVGNIETLV